MNIKEAYVCPKCGNTTPTVLAIQALMDDVRYDVVGCPECRTEWRAYYKVSDVSTEVTFVAPEETSTEVAPVEEAVEGEVLAADAE